MVDPRSRSLDAHRFLFVTGKGGVGKTTISAALAVALARRGRRVLVAMSGAHERLSALFGSPPIKHALQQVAPNIWATNIDPTLALREYGELVLKVKAVARAVFDNKYTGAFFRAVPGLYEWAPLGKAWYHTTERRADGSRRFDVVLFDAPSTGHGLDMLRVPRVILDIVPPGVLRRDAEKAWEMLRDPAQSGVVVVTLAEEMPTSETLELVAAVEEELHLPVVKVVVNAMHPPLFSEPERQALLRNPGLSPGQGIDASQPGEQGLIVAARRAAREVLEARCVARLRSELGVEPLIVPVLLEGADQPAGIKELSALF